MLITLEEARRHLQMDHTESDPEIADLAEEASLLVLDYLKKPDDSWQDEEGRPVDVPGVVVVAVKLVLGELYKNREADSDPLSERVMRLLERQRDPAMA